MLSRVVTHVTTGVFDDFMIRLTFFKVAILDYVMNLFGLVCKCFRTKIYVNCSVDVLLPIDLATYNITIYCFNITIIWGNPR